MMRIAERIRQGEIFLLTSSLSNARHNAKLTSVFVRARLR